MKLRAFFVTLAAATLTSTAGCDMQITPHGIVEVEPPGHVILVPDDYVWDGYEYVGVVDGEYVYLGPGDVWMPLDEDGIEHFHEWESHHHDWREHATRNDRYREDVHDHEHAFRHERRGKHDDDR